MSWWQAQKPNVNEILTESNQKIRDIKTQVGDVTETLHEVTALMHKHRAKCNAIFGADWQNLAEVTRGIEASYDDAILQESWDRDLRIQELESMVEELGGDPHAEPEIDINKMGGTF